MSIRWTIRSLAAATVVATALGVLTACGAASSTPARTPTPSPTSASATPVRAAPVPHAGDHYIANADLESPITDADLPWTVPGLASFLESERVAMGAPASSPKIWLVTLSDAGGKVWVYYVALSTDNDGYEAIATDASGHWQRVEHWHGPFRVPLCRALAADGVPADLGRSSPSKLLCRYAGKVVTYNRRFTP